MTCGGGQWHTSLKRTCQLVTFLNTLWNIRPCARLPVMMLLCFALITTSVFTVHSAENTFVELTAAERAWLDRNHDIATLYFNSDFPPIEFTASKGVFTGLAADVFGLVEKRLGVTFHKNPSENWHRHIQAFENGEFAIAPAMVRTVQRERYAFFTKPYATIPVVIISARSGWTDLTLDDLDGKRVAYVSKTPIENYLENYPNKKFEAIPMPDVVQGLQAASFGQVDAFAENIAVASHYIEKESITNLRLVGKTGTSVELSIGVSRKYPLLFSAVQKALSAVAVGIPVTRDPPHRSQRAELPHWAPTSDHGVIPLFRPGMQNLCWG